MDAITRDRITGCLLAGAVGDALGGGVEFDSWARIRATYGESGVRDYVPAYGRLGAITDDTQMTLFTAEGLIRAYTRARIRGITSCLDVTYHAYLRWLITQGESTAGTRFADDEGDGWLIQHTELWHRRAPGNTCLSALASGRKGTLTDPINNSKGCGGVMRAAPAGTVFPTTSQDPSGDETAFQVGCEVAAITHGHSDGYLPGGALAVIVEALVAGDDLAGALDRAEAALIGSGRTGRTLALLREARAVGRRGVPNVAAIERLGGGWVGEEALAIAVACSVGGLGDPEAALVASVNHSGDSDSTGSICGNILGAALGAAWIPERLLGRLELRDVIEQIAADLFTVRAAQVTGVHAVDDAWLQRYPGW